MMDCQEAEKLIQDELDGILSPDREAQLQAHVDGCVACSRTRQELKRLASAMGRLEDAPLPDQTWDRLLSHAIAQPGATRSHRYWRTALAGLAAAAALLLAAWWFGRTAANRRTSRAPQPSEVTRPMMADTRFSGAVAQADTSAEDSDRPRTKAASWPERADRDPAAPIRPARHAPAIATSFAPVAPPPSDQDAAAAKDRTVQLTGNDLYVYERALEFADMPGSSAPPTETLIVARTHAASGDIDEAIRSYEKAITDSIRSPIAPPMAGAEGVNVAAMAIMPLPPPELIAMMSGLEEPLEPHLLACLAGGE